MKIPKIPNINMPTATELFNDSPYDIEMPEIEAVNIPEVLAETYKPIIDNQNETINQLKSLYKQKESEYENKEKELAKSKKYNVIMLIIALVSMLVGIGSFIATIVMNYKG